MLKCNGKSISKFLNKLKEITIGKFNSKIVYTNEVDEMVMRTKNLRLEIKWPNTVDREPIEVWNAGQKLYAGLDSDIKVNLVDNTKDVIIKGNIIYIILENNQLYSLNIDKSTNLRAINCSKNPLSTLNISNNTNLVNLNCSYTKLSSINIDNNSNLGYFDCSNNKISTLNISNNINLTYLYCSNTKLSTIDIGKNINLQRVYLNNNYLTLEVIINILKALKKIEKINNTYNSKLCDLSYNNHTDFTQPPELVEALNTTRANGWNIIIN